MCLTKTKIHVTHCIESEKDKLTTTFSKQGNISVTLVEVNDEEFQSH